MARSISIDIHILKIVNDLVEIFSKILAYVAVEFFVRDYFLLEHINIIHSYSFVAQCKVDFG